MAIKATQQEVRMWLSHEIAERIYNLANILLIVALILGALATVLVVWMGNVKEDYLRRDLSGARERTAGLEREAAKLRVQLDREIQKRAPRNLTDAQKKTLVAELRGKFQDINVVVQKDLEAQSFATQLEIAFQEAGMQVHPYEMQPGEMFPGNGVHMYMPGGALAETEMKDDPLYIALKKANLFNGFTAKPFSSPTLLRNAPMLSSNQHIVYVGQKPPY